MALHGTQPLTIQDQPLAVNIIENSDLHCLSFGLSRKIVVGYVRTMPISIVLGLKSSQ